MRSIITILLLALSTCCFSQQDTAFRLIRTIPVAAADLAVDNLNNIYLLTITGQIRKYNANGDSVAVYNEIRKFGQLHTMDVTNPLNILLFYKDFSTLVMLDRFLSQRSTIDLRKLNILEVSAVGLSNDNNIWLFDAINNKLKKIDDKGRVLQETPDMRSLFPGAVLPEQIIDQNGRVYLYDPKSGIFVFDQYGSFHSRIPLTHLKNMAIIGNTIAGIDSAGLHTYNMGNLMEKKYQFPSSFGSFSNYIIGNTRIFGFSKDAISIYTFRF